MANRLRGWSSTLIRARRQRAVSCLKCQRIASPAIRLPLGPSVCRSGVSSSRGSATPWDDVCHSDWAPAAQVAKLGPAEVRLHPPLVAALNARVGYKGRA
jgi:hypothetical protein